MQKLFFTLATTIIIVGFSSKVIGGSPTPRQDNRYAPARLDVPNILSGYHVLAVLTEDNFICMDQEKHP